MPRTELGPAVCNRGRWNPADGNSPITKHDRLDARFRNATSKPPCEGPQTIGPATGVARSNLEPGESAFDDKPQFERGGFGAAVPPVCEGASCGADASAKITGALTSLEYLLSRARSKLNLVATTVADAPLYFGMIAAAAIMKHKLFRPHKITRNGRKLIQHVLLVRHNGSLHRHIGNGWFGKNYPYRWDQAASCYLDVRIAGKATNGTDLTWSQGAARLADDAIDNLSTQPRPPGPARELRECPHCFYETPVLGFFQLWLLAAIEPEEPPRLPPSNIYNDFEDGWVTDREGSAKVGRLVSLNDMRVTPRLARYYRECFRQVAKTIKRPVALTECDKVIASHWPLVRKKCRAVPKAYRADAIQACMERLVRVWADWNSAFGTFGMFADQAIDWEIADFLKQLRRQVPVQRSVNLNDPAPADDDKPDQPERTDMMRLDTFETQVAAAKRRLVAERLDCLNSRERRVIVGRLALNGRRPVSHKALAAELGIGEWQVRRFETAAVEKLRRAVQ